MTAVSHPTLLPWTRRNVPRYTSYPTAPHFTEAVGAASYRAWLAQLESGAALSLYVHLPFCRQLCWYCGCHTVIVHRPAPIEIYLDALTCELATVAALTPATARVSHLHWGGGTPTLLEPDQIIRLADTLRRRFTFSAEAEFAVEIDPRGFDAARAAALAEAGVTRASLGVQDVNPRVQKAINRLQSPDETAAAADTLRRHGVTAINVDLMYGLPHQSVNDLLATIESVLRLEPARIALFGYAHVPWLKKHQTLIDQEALPGTAARLAALQAGTRRLTEAGYVAVGLDHFARADDSLARALAQGRVKRNFQGYTVDNAEVLLGFGASAIGRLPQGYVQNVVAVTRYLEAIRHGGLAVQRGLAVSADDRLRGEVIERLMCELRVDLAAVAARYGASAAAFAPELAILRDYAADGLVRINGSGIEVAEDARPALRSVAAVFDRYLGRAPARHAAAV